MRWFISFRGGSSVHSLKSLASSMSEDYSSSQPRGALRFHKARASTAGFRKGGCQKPYLRFLSYLLMRWTQGHPTRKCHGCLLSRNEHFSSDPRPVLRRYGSRPPFPSHPAGLQLRCQLHHQKLRGLPLCHSQQSCCGAAGIGRGGRRKQARLQPAFFLQHHSPWNPAAGAA